MSPEKASIKGSPRHLLPKGRKNRNPTEEAKYAAAEQRMVDVGITPEDFAYREDQYRNEIAEELARKNGTSLNNLKVAALQDDTKKRLLNSIMGQVDAECRTLTVEKYLHKTDTLSGLPMRSVYEAELRRLMEFFSFPDEEEKPDRHVRKFDVVSKVLKEPFAALVFDIDWFKRVNDTYGHRIGDLAIRHVAQIIKKNLRSSDLVARYGGEEFVALVLGANGWATVVADKIRKAIEASPLEAEGKTIPLTVTVGVAAYSKELTTIVDLNERCIQLFTQADAALYRGKHQGRNQVVRYNESKDEAIMREKLKEK